jgi:cobalt/nickel transport system permease protein
MVLPHMLVASVVEGMLTALIVAYLQRSHSPLLQPAGTPVPAGPAGGFRRLRWLWAGLAALVVVSPLGLLTPGTAWGEWGTEELTKMGWQALPAGMEKLSGLWGAPLAGYNLPALGNASLGYVLSAALGLLVTGTIVWLFTMLLTRRSGPGQDGKGPGPGGA